ncbi:Chlorophyllase [Dillenia turbinata]|uniref:Chlorophyllase n=1 Tax=Dillenia turbinata TaxID=194707 RepID=A0AAN8ZKK9_9MAGN
MALLEAKTKSTLTTDVFGVGKYGVSEFTIETSSDSSSPPKPLFIVSPTSQGKYPVVLFLHGFCLVNKFYTSLLKHVSSHGYILVASQLYLPPCIASGSEEIDYAAAVTNWLAEGLLQQQLPTNVQPDLDKLVLAGHSRGGKAAFALALGLAKTSLKFSLLIGVDPVAGASKCKICQVKPIILTNVPKSFDLKLPVAVIGTGLGPTPRYLLSSCAPNGVNHKEFFNESKPPRCHFVTSDYGHMDMLDDDLGGLLGLAANCSCTNGKGPRDSMRKCVGGIMVAFIRAYFEGDGKDLRAIVKDPEIAPVKLDSVEFDEE